jgi:hypothetical protein
MRLTAMTGLMNRQVLATSFQMKRLLTIVHRRLLDGMGYCSLEAAAIGHHLLKDPHRL